ncbi:MAG: nuclear transport factor 2 family protein [Gammaproteobacteria bacterium]|nr:nuclear transport factor 2 family protein [Gammaproteobacteria bacterium]
MTARRVDELFQEAMNEGDLEKAMALYDDNAVFVQEPGKPAISGLDNIREVIRNFQSIKPELKVEVMQFVEAGDVAFFTLKWEIMGTSTEGDEIHMSSYDGNVVKRQPDGSWKTIIDNPFHGHHIGLLD